MDGESEGLRRQVARLDLTIQAEMEKCKVLQVSCLASDFAMPVEHCATADSTSRGHAAASQSIRLGMAPEHALGTLGEAVCEAL